MFATLVCIIFPMRASCFIFVSSFNMHRLFDWLNNVFKCSQGTRAAVYPKGLGGTIGLSSIPRNAMRSPRRRCSVSSSATIAVRAARFSSVSSNCVDAVSVCSASWRQRSARERDSSNAVLDLFRQCGLVNFAFIKYHLRTAAMLPTTL